MDWNRLYYFKIIAYHGSLKKAADAIGVNQSTMYRQLNELEEELQTKLFYRKKNGYQLTDNGLIALRSAASIEEHFQQLERQITKEYKPLSGVVSVEATEEILHALWLPDAEEFHQSFPDIEVKLEISRPYSVSSKVGMFPQIFLMDAVEPMDFLENFKLLDVEYCYCCHQQYAANKQGAESIVNGKSSSLHLVIPAHEMRHHKNFMQQYDALKVTKTSSVMVQLEYVQRKIAIGLLPKYMIQSYPDILVLGESWSSNHNVWFATHKGYEKNLLVDAVKGFIIEKILQRKIRKQRFLSVVE